MIQEEHINTIVLYLAQLGLEKCHRHIDFNLDNDKWINIHKIAQNQTIQGLVFDGVTALPKEVQPPRSITIPWLIEVDNIERANKKQQIIISRLKTIFENHGISFRILKGQSLATLYPNKLHRICGDIDIWFRSPEETEKANQAIESHGIKVERGGQHDSHYYFDGIEIEHHYNLIELHNPFFRKKLKEWERKEFDQSELSPSPCANLLLQITHILKHELNEGIGLRQIFDLALSLESLKYDKNELEHLCKEYGVLKWAQLLFSLIHNYLGLNKEKFPFLPKGSAAFLMEEIWHSGNFGYSDKRIGERPNRLLIRKLHTQKILLRKTIMLFTIAPEECFWNLILIIQRQFKELFHLK